VRILIVGAGAIGGFLAARLSGAGHDVAVVARGAHLQAIRTDGLRLVTAAGPDVVARVDAFGAMDEVGATDAVIVAVKSYQIGPLVPSIVGAASRTRMIVPVQNGIGWWYFQGRTGRHAGRAVRSVDPAGDLAIGLPADRIVPMFAFKAAEVTAPGVVRHIPSDTDRFPLGELDGAVTSRVRDLSAALTASGLSAPITDIRVEMWTKLLGNIYANPICALTRVPLGPAIAHPATRMLAVRLMQECKSVAAAHGVGIPVSFEERLARSASVGDARPSMLQDRDAGRPMELDAILAALVELGDLEGVPTPCVQSLLACLRLVEARVAH